MSAPRTLIYDIENSPSLGWYYDRYKEGNIIADKQGWYMLSFAYKWLGENKTHVRALPDYPGYSRNRKCDRSIVSELRGIISEADIIVAHNGDRHDLPKLNARLAYHNILPCRPPKTIDTYKAAKRYFRFTSNSLSHLASHFGIGDKLPNTGFNLWERCMDGDLEAWKTMKAYNVHDVDLLEAVYIRIRPFMGNHPNLNHISRLNACPTCQSPRVQARGFSYLKTGKRQRIQCTDCGSWSVSGELIRVAG